MNAQRKIDIWADQPHYLDHVAPIWAALPDDVRGRFLVPNRLRDAAAAYGIDAVTLSDLSATALRWSQDVLVVCSWGGVQRWQRAGRPLVLLNHGAGQTYLGGHPAYSGGTGRDIVALFLEPGPHAAEATRMTLPAAPVVEVGCAKLDRWHDATFTAAKNAAPVVAVSTHWNCRVVAETGSAWSEYRAALLALADEYTVIAHAHPLIASRVRADAEAAGVEFVASFDEVLARADLYVSDTSSTLYEFASTGRPVLCVNSRRYRRRVHHGLRFWDAVPGLQCDRPADVAAQVKAALADPPEAQALRNRAVARAYVACDGHAAERAAAALVTFAETGQVR